MSKIYGGKVSTLCPCGGSDLGIAEIHSISFQFNDTYSVFKRKLLDQQAMIARAERDPLHLESQVAASRVLEGERCLQLLRDEAQVAYIRVREKDEDIGHMLDHFRETLRAEENAVSSGPSDLEASLPDETTLDEESDVSEANSSQFIGSEKGVGTKQSEIEGTCTPVTPLMTSALKQLNEEANITCSSSIQVVTLSTT